MIFVEFSLSQTPQECINNIFRQVSRIKKIVYVNICAFLFPFMLYGCKRLFCFFFMTSFDYYMNSLRKIIRGNMHVKYRHVYWCLWSADQQDKVKWNFNDIFFSDQQLISFFAYCFQNFAFFSLQMNFNDEW